MKKLSCIKLNYRRVCFQYIGKLGSISLAQALMPPLRFFTLRKPALIITSRARVERLRQWNTTIPSAGFREAWAHIFRGMDGPHGRADLGLVRFAYIQQANGVIFANFSASSGAVVAFDTR